MPLYVGVVLILVYQWCAVSTWWMVVIL